MTNRLAIILGALIFGALVLDYALYDTEHLVFLGRKMFALLDYIAFWR